MGILLNRGRREAAQTRMRQTKKEAMADALRETGVYREEFVDLLLEKVELSEVKLAEDGGVENAEELISPLREAYGCCFAVPQETGVDVIAPPSGALGPDAPTNLSAALAERYC